MNQPMAPDAALEWLSTHKNLETMGPMSRALIKQETPSLEGIRQLVDLMGNPQKAMPVIHITGTNGKTSTSRITSRLLMERGISVGTYVSPHLNNVNERWLYNLEPITDEELAESLSAVAALEDLVDTELTYFEIITAAAFWWFADKPVDVAVVEVGLGGTWDATNVVDSQVSVITSIALDHQRILGETREEIATDKSGIIKPDSIAIIGEPDPALRNIFEARDSQSIRFIEKEFGVTQNQLAVGGRVLSLFTPHAKYENVFANVMGEFQGNNVACSVAAVEALFDAALPEKTVENALADLSIPGRMQIASSDPLIVIDAAHNPAGAQALALAAEETFAPGSMAVVLGLLDGHDPVEMMSSFDQNKVRLVITCNAENDRRIESEQIAKDLMDVGFDVEECDSISNAISAARERVLEDEMILIFGSLYVIGPAQALLLPT